jgi:response regulator of citrate/malate metabolism
LQLKPMPTNRITMRRIRETLRLHLQAGLSYNEVGRALKISKSVVGKYVSP